MPPARIAGGIPAGPWVVDCCWQPPAVRRWRRPRAPPRARTRRPTASHSPARSAGPRTRPAGAADRSSASRHWRRKGPARSSKRSRRRARASSCSKSAASSIWSCARAHDPRAVPHHRRPDRAVARHHAHPRRARHRRPRRGHPAHPRAPRRGGRGEDERLGRRMRSPPSAARTT